MLHFGDIRDQVVKLSEIAPKFRCFGPPFFFAGEGPRNFLLIFINLGNSVSYISYHIVDHKRQNRFKVGTNKPKLKVKMQSVSDDDVRKRLLEQTRRFELAAKGVFRLGRCYIFWQSIPGRASNWESTATDG